MRTLLRFWVAVLAVLATGAVVLTVLGPPKPRTPPKPAAVPAGTPKPAAKPLQAVTQAAPKPPAAGLFEPDPYDPSRMLPRISADGVTPARAYATPTPPPPPGHPRIALIIDGIGLDQALSERAIRELPAAVTMAFSAYTPDQAATRLGWDSRVAGHECLVSIPMEPAGYPLSDEGTRALLTGASRAQNRQNLFWALSRMPGCVGATGASDGGAGERFAASPPAFDAMLHEIRSRGLLYLDPRPGATLAPDPGIRINDFLLDRPDSPDAPITAAIIDSRLAALERLARERGTAIAVAGPPLPVLIEHLKAWIARAQRRGFVIVPITNLYGSV